MLWIEPRPGSFPRSFARWEENWQRSREFERIERVEVYAPISREGVEEKKRGQNLEIRVYRSNWGLTEVSKFLKFKVQISDATLTRSLRGYLLSIFRLRIDEVLNAIEIRRVIIIS